MNHAEFVTLCGEFHRKEQEILGWKESEYSSSSGNDRLENFKTVGSFLNINPEEVCLCYLMKHLHSITLAVTGDRQYAWDWETDGGEGLKQRFVDAVNYLRLLAALLDERNRKSE